MAFGYYVGERKGSSKRRNVNVNELISKAKIDRKKEKKTSIIVATVAISALAVTSYIITF